MWVVGVSIDGEMVSSFQHMRLECTIRAGPACQSCEALGVDTVEQGVWKQPVYKAHLDGIQQKVNHRGQLKTEACHGKMRAPPKEKADQDFSKEKMLPSGPKSLWIDSLAHLLSLSSTVMCVCVCECVPMFDTEVKSVKRDNKQ